MYLTGFAAIIVAILAVLMILSILPMTPQIVGGGFLLLCLGFAGPFVGRA